MLQLAKVTESQSVKPYPYDRKDAEAGCAALGYAIDGRVAFSLPLESLPGIRLVSDGDSEPFRGGVLTTEKGLKVGLIRIGSFRTRTYPTLCRQSWANPQVWDAKGQLKISELHDVIDEAWYSAWQRFRFIQRGKCRRSDGRCGKQFRRKRFR